MIQTYLLFPKEQSTFITVMANITICIILFEQVI